MTDVIEIGKNTWSIEDDYVRFFLLAGEEQAVMIDSGFNSANALKFAKTLTDLPIMLLNTHGDGDHISGTAAFEEIHMHVSDYINCHVMDKYPDTSLVAVKEGDSFDLGARKLEIYEIPGHTMGSIAILDKFNRTLYAGDSVQDGHIFMFGGHRVPEKYEASLEKLIAMSDKYDTIIASHGTVKLPADYAKNVLEDWKNVRAGKYPGTETELHGTMVKSYDAKYCGFYCN